MLSVLLCGFAAVVSAQDVNTFKVRAGNGIVTGTEQFTIADTPSGHEMSATISMKRGGSEAKFAL